MTRSNERRGLRSGALALLVVALAAPGAARAAGPSVADVESARALYKEGRELRQKGDLNGALEKLRAAWALAPTPITGLEVGKAYEAVGKLLQAYEAFVESARMPERVDESAKAKEARAEALAERDRLRPLVPSLRVEASPPGVTLTKVTIDGTAVPREALGAPRMVDPGQHTVEVEAEGMRGRAEVTVAARELRTVPVTLERVEVPPAPAPEASKAAPPTPPPERAGGGTSPLVYVGLATAGVGVVVGTVTGIMTLSSASTVKESCPASRCPPSAHGDLDAAATTAMISTIAFAVAGAGVVTAVMGWTVAAPAREAPRAGASLAVTPGGVSIHGRF